MEICTKLLWKCGMRTGEPDNYLQFFETLLETITCEVVHVIILDILVHFPVNIRHLENK